MTTFDKHIATLNEIINTKYSSVSGAKRQVLRERKAIAKKAIELQNNTADLKAYLKEATVTPHCPQASEVLAIIADMVQLLQLKEKREAKKAQPKETATAKVEETEKEETKAEEAKKRGRKSFRKVGDIHPKHPDLVWTEYKPGLFDWRHAKKSSPITLDSLKAYFTKEGEGNDGCVAIISNETEHEIHFGIPQEVALAIGIGKKFDYYIHTIFYLSEGCEFIKMPRVNYCGEGEGTTMIRKSELADVEAYISGLKGKIEFKRHDKVTFNIQ